MQIRTIDETNRALLPYVPLVSQLTGKDTTLDRIRPLMELLDNPQDKIRIIHLAGTSGKTSTAYFIAGLLTAAGKRTGLTVSPHVDSVTERVQIDGQPLTDDVFCSYLGEFLDVVAQAPAKPSYFELLYAFSFWVFEREKVEYAVVETGMGGLYDATNVADRADKLCVITDIGFDHMHILGHTLAEIATQKIGIVHTANPVIMYKQTREVDDVVTKWVETHDASLHRLDPNTEHVKYGTLFARDFPDFQQRNWLLAYAAYRYLCQRYSLPALSQEQLQRTQQIQVPGRMERRMLNGKTLIMDGAHNGQKMETFLSSFRQLYPNVKPAVLLALKEGKEPADVAPLLAPLASRIIITTFQTSQDLPAKSIKPEQLATLFTEAGAPNVVATADMRQAYQALTSGPEEVCIITGSFYLLSQLRNEEGLT